MPLSYWLRAMSWRLIGCLTAERARKEQEGEAGGLLQERGQVRGRSAGGRRQGGSQREHSLTHSLTLTL